MRKTTIVAAVLAGFLLVVANGFAFWLWQREGTTGGTPAGSETAQVEPGVGAASPAVAERQPTPVGKASAVPTPQVSMAQAVEVALQQAPTVKLVGQPVLVQTERGLAWQVLTERGVLIVDAQTGKLLYNGLPVEQRVEAPAPQPAAVGMSAAAAPTGSAGGVASPVVNAVTAATPTPPVQQGYPVSALDAAAIATQWVPGSRLVQAPELVIFQGVPAYEVVLDVGVLYIDATTGQVLYDGTVPPARPRAAGRSDDTDSGDSSRDEHDDDHGDRDDSSRGEHDDDGEEDD